MSGYPDDWPQVSLRVKCEADWMCVRCGHPGAAGATLDAMSRVNERTRLLQAQQVVARGTARLTPRVRNSLFRCRTLYRDPDRSIYWLVWPDHPCVEGCTHPRNGKRRQLTVHHLDGDKGNLRWWNLAPLCQVCHLHIQAKVQMERGYLWPHTGWFRPYVAGYYAEAVLGEEVTREGAVDRMEELLAAGQPHLYGG